MLLPALRHAAQPRPVIRTMADNSAHLTSHQHQQPLPMQRTAAPFDSQVKTSQFHLGDSSTSSSPHPPQTPSKNMNPDNFSTPIATSMAAEFKKPFDISNLMSPPEPMPFDNFNSPAAASSTMMRVVTAERPRVHPPLSPPISPFAKPASNIGSEPTASVNVTDPILYPGAETTSSPPQSLFSPTESAFHTSAQRLVDEHVAARDTALFRRATPPQRDEYELALYFKSAVMKNFMANPRGWLRKERELLAADRKMLGANRNSINRLAPILPARIAMTSKPQPIRTHVTKVQKPDKIRAPRPPKQTARTNRATPGGGPVRSTIRVGASGAPGDEAPRVRTVAPNREDKDFASLPDYCPPLSSLPNKANSLKVDWKGNALDLSRDPFVHLLHPDEVSLAAGLRLDCATYLTSKRRIFVRRLECAHIGKEFRKTDAQQACKIDVNKASKLWSAYEKVGWLALHWMKGHLANTPHPATNSIHASAMM